MILKFKKLKIKSAFKLWIMMWIKLWITQKHYKIPIYKLSRRLFLKITRFYIVSNL